MNKIKRTLEKALSEAGTILKRAMDQPKHIQYKNKSPVSLVTKTDKAIEQRIIDIIHARFPHHAILAEESGSTGPSTVSRSSAGSTLSRWLIDPLDGTTNFAHGLPCVCVSIAYEEGGVLKVGGVWNPFYKEWFWAEANKGASLNGKKIRVSKTKSLSTSLLVTGFPYDRIERAEYYLKIFKRFMVRTHGIRRLGSAALDLCYVACGRFDGYWEFNLAPWDQAAAGLIAQEAGATLSDFSGRPMSIYARQTLATNGRIHKEMLSVLRPLVARRGTL